MGLTLPAGDATVSVSVISPNAVYQVPPSMFLVPEIRGTTYDKTPCLCFLVTHKGASKKTTRLLFDLGIRKDTENLPATVLSAIEKMPDLKVQTSMDTYELLQRNGIEQDMIDGIIFSHWHFDHIGDPARFPNSRRIVGPGFQAHCLPGWPEDPDSAVDQHAFEPTSLEELTFTGDLTIGSLKAIDFFKDGSFFILDTPGHAVGHISALARTTKGPCVADDTFVLLAGDVAHHVGELRPSAYRPLPPTIPLYHDSARDQYRTSSAYMAIHPHQCTTKPFYQASEGGFNLDASQMRSTANSIMRLDGDDRVFVLLSHDAWLLDVVKLFPACINDWREEGLADRARWRFLQDFE